MRDVPRTLFELWLWGHTEWLNSQLEPPDRLHAKHPYPERDKDIPESLSAIRRRGTAKTIPNAIIGRPFTRAFIRYLDDVRPMTPARRALKSLYARSERAQTPEYRVCFAVVEAGHDLSSAIAIAGVNDEIAERALRFLWHKTQREVSIEEARRPKPVQPAGRSVA